ncbi:TRAP transporter substrate-binding protein DctP [Alkalihalobacterium alkalinitrilicum]|uniref:TRAP transporter substrate-binding protein DctP n=1 Tax=Alkalihalobacterium alkalinitrilicum TaxID=427920 RepID=UPI0013031D70|nr:TRAP transporter substrate-binding protein DctP [Alkalihalobacterium alkalinitrilicum]
MKKMKRIVKPIVGAAVAATMALGLVACGGGNEGASAPADSNDDGENAQTEAVEEMRLRASSGLTAQHFWDRGFFTPLMDRIDSETDGAISFEAFTSGELVPLGTEFDALRQGTIDVALTFMAPYDPQRFPYSEVAMLPLLDSDAVIASTAMQNMMKSDRELKDGKTYYELEFADKGLVAFANPLTEPYIMGTTRQKVESVSDFSEAIRLRTASRVHEILANNLGITAISMPITDAYDALSRNALDGFFYNVPDWKAFGFDELIKHAVEGANFGHFVGHTVLTQETWDKLPADVQEKFATAADEIIFDGANLTKSETEENRESTMEKGGEFTHLNDLDPEVQEFISQAIVETWNEWIESLEGQGHAGKEMALLWRDMIVEAGGVLPDQIMELE